MKIAFVLSSYHLYCNMQGRLPNGQEIAVKRQIGHRNSPGQGDLDFKNEVLLVAKLGHRNLVKLLGFCLEKNERILVYEFMPNSSLDRFIFGMFSKIYIGICIYETALHHF